MNLTRERPSSPNCACAPVLARIPVESSSTQRFLQSSEAGPVQNLQVFLFTPVDQKGEMDRCAV
jgi:hypothetical protein